MEGKQHSKRLKICAFTVPMLALVPQNAGAEEALRTVSNNSELIHSAIFVGLIAIVTVWSRFKAKH